MTGANTPAAKPTTRPARVFGRLGWALRRLWDPSGWDDALKLTIGERERPATIAMFYAEIGTLADRSCLSSDQDPKILPALPDDWTELRNSMVLMALRADRKLASGEARDSEAGIALLRQAIVDADQRLAGLPAGEPGRNAAPGPDRDAARRMNASRYRSSYYRFVLALLHVRLGRALERAGDAKAAEAAFRAALIKQPSLMTYTAQELARFLGGCGRFEEADQALRSTRSILTLAAQVDVAQTRAGIVGSFVEGARKRGELRKVMPILEHHIADLARLRTEFKPADSDQSPDLLGWYANAIAVRGTCWRTSASTRRRQRRSRKAVAFTPSKVCSCRT